MQRRAGVLGTVQVGEVGLLQDRGAPADPGRARPARRKPSVRSSLRVGERGILGCELREQLLLLGRRERFLRKLQRG